MNHSPADKGKLSSSYRPHLDVAVWLKTLELEQYATIFKDYSGVECLISIVTERPIVNVIFGHLRTVSLVDLQDILDCTGREILNLGVTNSAHRARLVTSLAILREKYRKALARRSLGAMNRPLSPQTAAKTDGYINSRTGTEGHWTERTCHETVGGLLENTTSPVKTDFNKNNFPKMEPEATPEVKPTDGDRKLEDCAWYHGRLSRADAETLVEKNGQFLVRDCISQPGDLVLTCNCGGNALHFMINRIVLPGKNGIRLSPAKKKLLYQFEDEQFSTVVDLVEFYLNHAKAVTELSRCVITEPVVKQLEANGNGNKSNLHKTNILEEENRPGNYAVMNRKLPPVPSPPKRAGLPNQKIPNPNLTKRPLPKPPTMYAELTKSAAKKPLSQRVMLMEASRRLAKASSEGKLNSSLETEPSGTIAHYSSARDLVYAGETLKPAPTKPKRAPSLKKHEKPTVIVRNKLGEFREETLPENQVDDDYHEYCDIDYDELDHSKTKSPLPKPVPNVPPPLPMRKSVNKAAYLERDSACVPDMSVYDFPVPSRRLCRDLENAYSPAPIQINPVPLNVRKKIDLEHFDGGELMGEREDLKPFDGEIWAKLSRVLLDADPLSVAKSLTKMDCQFLDYFPVDDKKFEICEKMESGLSLTLLPQGERLRRDLKSRSETLAIFVIGTIVKTSDRNERVRMLKQWIEICRCLRFQILNEFAFDTVMKALSSPQISSLRSSWQLLRTEHTPSAVCYETVLKPSLRKMEKLENAEEKCVIPHLQPVLRFMDAKSSSESLKIFDWEDFDDMFGLDVLWSLLESSRKWFNGSLGAFKEEAEERIFLPSSCCSLEMKNQLEKLSQTEFQMKFLWGSKGAMVESRERFEKMDKLLTLMANKVEAADT